MVRGPNSQHTITLTIMSSQTWPRLILYDSGVRTNSYECPTHIKYAKRIIYVWSGSGMSLMWMRGPYHYITVWYMSKIYTYTLTSKPKLNLAKAIVIDCNSTLLLYIWEVFKDILLLLWWVVIRMFPHPIMTWPLTNTNTDRSWSRSRVKVKVKVSQG